MPSLKLTERRIAELPVPADKYVRYWDTEVKGLFVRVTSKGSKRYYFEGRKKGNTKSIYHTGPRCSDYSLEEMRDDARAWNVALSKGDNPFAEAEKSVNPTLYELCRENLRLKEMQVSPRRLSASYLRDIEMYTRRVGESEMGGSLVDQVTVASAGALLLSFPPKCSDELRGWLSNCYDLAIRRDYVPLGFNPWKYTEKRYQPPKPEDLPRFTDDEIAKIAEYLHKAERGEVRRRQRINPIWIKYIWFLIRNGTRPNDTRIIERSWLRERGGIHYILHPGTKTGEKRFILSEASVLDVRETMKIRPSSVFLFPGRTDDVHLDNYKKEFNYMREAIGVDKPPYAIRRWFAHVGRSVYQGDIGPVQRLVGWETEEIALRYAGDDESFMEKFLLDNAEICRVVSAKVEEVTHV